MKNRFNMLQRAAWQCKHPHLLSGYNMQKKLTQFVISFKENHSICHSKDKNYTMNGSLGKSRSRSWSWSWSWGGMDGRTKREGSRWTDQWMNEWREDNESMKWSKCLGFVCLACWLGVPLCFCTTNLESEILLLCLLLLLHSFFLLLLLFLFFFFWVFPWQARRDSPSPIWVSSSSSSSPSLM